MKFKLLVAFCLFVAFASVAQEADSVIVQDSATVESINAVGEDDGDEEEVVYHAAPDTTLVERRSFDESKLQEFKNDPEFNYELPPTVAESLWDRFLIWLNQFLNDFFDGAVSTNWGRVITYIIGLALLIVLIMLMLKVNAFKVIYSAEGVEKKYNVFDENIHEMDFEQLISEAAKNQDYRKGIRLLFLYALKVLSDKQLIQWQSGKTNHDYVAELGEKDLKAGLNELSFYFEYAWYGNFNISQDIFHRVQSSFNDWKTRIR